MSYRNILSNFNIILFVFYYNDYLMLHKFYKVLDAFETRRKSTHFPSKSMHQTMKNMKNEVDLCNFFDLDCID